MSCPFCNAINLSKLKIFREGCAIAILNLMPITKGHLLIVPDAHVKSVNELNASQQLNLFYSVNVAVALVKKTFFPEGVNVFFNEGEIAGQTKEHFHVHVVPRYSGDDFQIPDRKSGKKIPISHAERELLIGKLSCQFPDER